MQIIKKIRCCHLVLTPCFNTCGGQQTGPHAITSYTYVDGLYEKVTLPSGQTEERHYIGDIAILTIKNRTATVPGTQQRRYLHQDHLGSVTVISDDYADVVERFSFDPWGKRRAPNLQTLEQKLGAWNSLSAYQKSNLTLSALTLASTTTNQGFTGHEQMDPVGLIHMGGRVYDAEIGRFISADPFVQDRTDLQAFSHYSYVRNNPLRYTDPSGYSWNGTISGIETIVVWGVRTAIIGSLGWDFTGSTFIANLAWSFVGNLVKSLPAPTQEGTKSKDSDDNACNDKGNYCTHEYSEAGSITTLYTQTKAANGASNSATEAAVGYVSDNFAASAMGGKVNSRLGGQMMAAGVSSKAQGGRFTDGIKNVRCQVFLDGGHRAKSL